MQNAEEKIPKKDQQPKTDVESLWHDVPMVVGARARMRRGGSDRLQIVCLSGTRYEEKWINNKYNKQ